MKTDKTKLYYVTPTNKAGLHLPRKTKIYDYDRDLLMIPLSDTPEAALAVAYPDLFTNKDWSVKKFALWEIEQRPRHGIINPKVLGKMWGIEHAETLGLWGCFRSLRMTEVGEFKIINDIKVIDEFISIETADGTRVISYRTPVNI